MLLRADLLAFPLGRLPPRDREMPAEARLPRDLMLEVVADADGSYLAAYSSPDVRLLPQAESLPQPAAPQLPVLFPKLQGLLPFVKELFGAGAVTVVVLNTHRHADKNAGEPIGAGPLVSRFLAEHLGVKWRDSGGAPAPDLLGRAGSTWIDVLRENDTAEDADSQSRFLARLNHVLSAWDASPGPGRVALTTTGGLPQLKEVTERLVATRVGEERVWLVQQPERGNGGEAVLALRYGDKWSEREALRFHCAEALRKQDFISAYGLARRCGAAPWALRVLDTLGPLLELPTAGGTDALQLLPLERFAAQLETAATVGDVCGVVRKLGQFFECATMEMMAASAALAAMGLEVDRAGTLLWGTKSAASKLPKHQIALDRQMKNSTRFAFRPELLLDSWPSWLAQNGRGRRQAASTALADLVKRYTGGGDEGVRGWRNRLAHSKGLQPDIQRLAALLLDRGMCACLGQPYGGNFVSQLDVAALMAGLLPPNQDLLPRRVQQALRGLTETVSGGVGV